jgi:hypothetical protein
MSLTTERDRLLDGPRRDLAAARASRDAWLRLAVDVDDSTDGRVDRNRAARAGVLWALQHDRRAADLPLARFLLEQEIVHDRVLWYGPRPGGDCLLLAALLVAEQGRLEDVWLHWRAIDGIRAGPGYYHHFHLLTPGVAAVVAHVRASRHPDRDRILARLDPDADTDAHTDTAVRAWLAAQQQRFPRDPDARSWQEWAGVAALLGERERSRRFITAWAGTVPRTAGTLSALATHLAGLGYPAEAARAQRELLAMDPTGWSAWGQWLDLARYERQAGDAAAAVAALDEAERQTAYPCGNAVVPMSHQLAMEYFLLVPATDDRAVAMRLLDTGEEYLRAARLPIGDAFPEDDADLLDAGTAAAEHVGDRVRADRYRQWRAEERLDETGPT